MFKRFETSESLFTLAANKIQKYPNWETQPKLHFGSTKQFLAVIWNFHLYHINWCKGSSRTKRRCVWLSIKTEWILMVVYTWMLWLWRLTDPWFGSKTHRCREHSGSRCKLCDWFGCSWGSHRVGCRSSCHTQGNQITRADQLHIYACWDYLGCSTHLTHARPWFGWWCTPHHSSNTNHTSHASGHIGIYPHLAYLVGWCIHTPIIVDDVGGECVGLQGGIWCDGEGVSKYQLECRQQSHKKFKH